MIYVSTRKLEMINPYEFGSRFDLYKSRFGATFSYYLVVRSSDEALKQRVYDLMQQVLDGEIEPITDKMLGIELPPGVLS